VDHLSTSWSMMLNMVFNIFINQQMKSALVPGTFFQNFTKLHLNGKQIKLSTFQTQLYMGRVSNKPSAAQQSCVFVRI